MKKAKLKRRPLLVKKGRRKGQQWGGLTGGREKFLKKEIKKININKQPVQ